MSKLNHKIEYYDEAKTKVWNEFWFNAKDELHRIGNPARIWYYENGNVESKHYYLNGKASRIDGPASIYYYENGNVECEYYYLNGKDYLKEEYYQLPEVKEYLKQKAFDEVMLEILSE